MSLPALLPNGFLPPGVHAATLHEILDRFGTASPRRQVLAERLEALLREPSSQREVFAHEAARLQFEADVFLATEAIGMEELMAWLSVYQLSREMMPRGIVEVLWHD